MKFGIAIIAALVIFLSPSVNGAESDVVRVFDKKTQMSGEKVMEYLKQADLEKYGFKKTVEESTETDENGKITKKTTIYYLVTDDCSRVWFWESILEQRLPAELRNSKLASTIVKEVKDRITGRKTKTCKVGLEIHPNRCSGKACGNDRGKRGIAGAMHFFCWSASINYAN
ncbi:uncharacterized protein LOC114525181 [Dendronephthya gigantea]|uniref:uncharacterized protein LOC114525181 n=1 Tax=Dendronephthya gigantea TaxID=151771 RepID=UPI00106AEB40|nr:uncharacterized protein LOC114525181 [Dendronephthya gigantea]